MRDAQLTAQLDRRVPYSQFEYVSVTFSATANADTDIRHSLSPAVPEDVRWEVVSIELSSAPATPPVIYRDSSATRKAWQTTHLYLRCTLPSAVVRLRLFLE